MPEINSSPFTIICLDQVVTILQLFVSVGLHVFVGLPNVPVTDHFKVYHSQQMSIPRYCDGIAYSHDCKTLNFGALYLLFASVKFWFYFSNGKLTPLRKYFWQKIRNFSQEFVRGGKPWMVAQVVQRRMWRHPITNWSMSQLGQF